MAKICYIYFQSPPQLFHAAELFSIGTSCGNLSSDFNIRNDIICLTRHFRVISHKHRIELNIMIYNVAVAVPVANAALL